MSVVDLNGKPADVQGVDYDRGVIDLLERALAQAKSEKATGVAIVLVLPMPDHKHDNQCYWHGPQLTLLAGTVRLGYRINVEIDANLPKAYDEL
jgi:hypothetical protein